MNIISLFGVKQHEIVVGAILEDSKLCPQDTVKIVDFGNDGFVLEIGTDSYHLRTWNVEEVENALEVDWTLFNEQAVSIETGKSIIKFDI